jgi:allophanate hydrolase subunit 2
MRSRSTCSPVGFWGFIGQPRSSGDRLAIGPMLAEPSQWPARLGVSSRNRSRCATRLRVLLGPHFLRVPTEVSNRLLSESFTVSTQLNRVACRLGASVELRSWRVANMLPVGTIPGTFQIIPSGGLWLLLAERQTTDGYPQ